MRPLHHSLFGERSPSPSLRDREELGSADQGQPRRFLHRQGYRAVAKDAFEAGRQLGVELEVAAEQQNRLARPDRDDAAHRAGAAASRLQRVRQGGHHAGVGQAQLELQPAGFGETLQGLEALDGDARRIVAGAAVELDCQQAAAAGFGGRFEVGAGLVLEHGRFELAGWAEK